jgi:hypothetical protein
MGYGSRLPTSNDPPASPGKEKSPWLFENDLTDEVCLLLNELARRCEKCRLAVRVEYLKDGLCPACRE